MTKEELNIEFINGVFNAAKESIGAHIDKLIFLLDSGADINARHTGKIDGEHLFGVTALHLASRTLSKMEITASARLTKFLVANRAIIFAQDNAGNTPLHYATRYRNREVFRYLYKIGGDKLLKIKNKNGHKATSEEFINSYPNTKISTAYSMIEYVNNVIKDPNWFEHQPTTTIAEEEKEPEKQNDVSLQAALNDLSKKTTHFFKHKYGDLGNDLDQTGTDISNIPLLKKASSNNLSRFEDEETEDKVMQYLPPQPQPNINSEYNSNSGQQKLITEIVKNGPRTRLSTLKVPKTPAISQSSEQCSWCNIL